jgi:hypothetical protein
MRRDAWVLVWLWVVGYLFWPVRYARRWYLRLKLRRKMRRLGMIPGAALILGTIVPETGTAQAVHAAPDSLVGTPLSIPVIGRWSDGTLAIYCLTWVAERDDRPGVLVIIDAAPADATVRPLCPDGRGGFYPLWIDGPTCPPGQVSPFTDRDFVIVRCGADNISRYRRRSVPVQRSE